MILDEMILKIRNLKKSYQDGFIINIDSFDIKKNTIVAVIGPNGSGKSTLIKLINLLEKPENGSIFFNGIDILRDDVDKVSIRKKMAVVFQQPLLFSTSVYNNIMLGINLRKKSFKEKKYLFDYLVEKLDLASLLNKNPKFLSGGQQQRVALARALILEPELLLLDEPLSNIDQFSRENLRQVLFDILKDIKRSTLYITHDRNEALIIADEIAVMNSGRIVQSGKKDEVFSKPKDEFVARFLGIENIYEGKIVDIEKYVCKVVVNGSDNKKSRRIISTDDFDNYEGEIENIKENIIYVQYSSDFNFSVGDEVIVTIRPEDVTLFNLSDSILYGQSMLYEQRCLKKREANLNNLNKFNNLNNLNNLGNFSYLNDFNNFNNLNDLKNLYGISALNFFIGKISLIENFGFLKKIELDCGFRIISFITNNSAERMNLIEGKILGASVKASSVHIFLK